MKPARWCRHIKWIVTTYGWRKYLFQDGQGYECWAESDWRYCPICGTPRPSAKPRPAR